MCRIKIGINIKTLRQANGLSQCDLAEAFSVTPQAVSKWERNKSYPDITMLPTIASYFGVSIDSLLTFDKEASF